VSEPSSENTSESGSDSSLERHLDEKIGSLDPDELALAPTMLDSDMVKAQKKTTKRAESFMGSQINQEFSLNMID